MSETKLTRAQWSALADIDKYDTPRIRFPTGEALRKAGLVTRETDVVVGLDYANDEGVWVQWRGEPREHHRWYLSQSGRQALKTRAALSNPESE